MFDLAALSLPEGAVIIDGGANTGQFMDMAFATVRYPRIIAIEMLPDLAREAQRRHPSATVLNCALFYRALQVTYRRTRETQMSSLYEPTAEYSKYYPGECAKVSDGEVQAYTLDALAEMLMLEHVDLLKLDLQGAELVALSGATNLLRYVDHVVVECEFIELYRGQPLAGAIREFMEGHHPRFEFVRSLEDHYRGETLVAADWWFRRKQEVAA